MTFFVTKEPLVKSEEEARQLAKVMNSFRHMELNASSNVVKAGSSASSAKSLMSPQNSANLNRSASMGNSAKFRGKFQELKQNANDVINSDSHKVNSLKVSRSIF